ncbi:metallophosphoesterase [Arthrobacter sp. efr-133-TYG-118]|uniref:metallophosphoesterase n=1 Tax=Arthrobacter sp. efr-133-TYG-118 TaxID=3040279 RepID=UPI00254F156A|nr:metallophosphoesterase [Arthrobacter sp. efr-133-TYG-118]
MAMTSTATTATRPRTVDMTPALGGRVGLMGDVHGDAAFLRSAATLLAAKGCTSLVQLGDFGLIWRGTRAETRALAELNDVLTALGLPLYVVLGNHENYDLIDALPRNDHGVARLFSHIGLLPRSGMIAAGRGGLLDTVHMVGWLSGAASIDRGVRLPGESWWEAELTTDEQAQALLSSAVAPDVVLAHEALSTPVLLARLGDGFGWNPQDLQYARMAQREHTARVLSVLDPGKETLLVSGHYHFRHSERAILERLSDGEVVSLPVRQEILDRERMPGSLAMLDLTGDAPQLEDVRQ